MAGRTVVKRANTVLVIAALFLGSASVYAVARRVGEASNATLTEVNNATLVSGSGVRSVARVGSEFAVGDRLITGSEPRSNALLRVGGRILWLGAGSTVTRESVRGYILEAGSIIGGGAGLQPLVIRSDEALVSPSPAGTWRVDRGFTTRIATYSGVVHLRTDAGEVMDVPALHQTSAAGTALPPSPGPLQLTPGDLREQIVVPGIVSLDGYISRVAAGLDGPNKRGASAAAAVAASFGLPRSTAAEPVSERVIPAVIAQATTSGRPARYATVRALRADGGSWGVVAVLAGVSTIEPLQKAVTALLDLTTTAPAPLADLPEWVRASPGVATAPDNPPAGAGGGAGPGPQPAPSPGVRPTKSPSPNPSGVTLDPAILGGIIDVLNTLLSPSPRPPNVPSLR